VLPYLQPYELTSTSRLIVSPGIPPTHPVVQKAAELGCEIVGDVELAFREFQLKPRPLIGITGTNGKTTATLLTTHMLGEAKAVGNIGEPLLDELEGSEPLVIELSSYQLETASTQVLQSAAVLNITPDHLDHHGSMRAYAAAKLRIGSCLKEGARLYVYEKIEAKNALKYGFEKSSDLHSDGEWIVRFQKREIELPAQFRHIRSHDVENFLAAYALARDAGKSPQECVDAFATFEKPPHRIQFVREIDGVKYYDDSKGTNIDAVIRAVESIPGTIVLIAGGVHKGESYHSWIEAFQGRVKAIVAIGQAAPLMEQDLASHIPFTHCSTLAEAVHTAKALAKPSETVLLSPGCASFDMFKSYKDRGEQFQDLILQL